MGIYTIRDDKNVNEAVARDLEFIVNRIRVALPARAVILGGGFGRGEGSVLVTVNGVRPVNDYDIFVAVSDNDGFDFRKLGREIAKHVGIRSVDLIPIQYSDFPTLPATQFHYDLKYGGTLLWGENVLSQIPQYSPGCIERHSGETVLLNRLVCALEAFSENFVHKGMSDEEKFFLVNQTGKVVNACVEALLIDKNRYHHSYAERRRIFDAEFREWATLRRLNHQATDFKLAPSDSPAMDAITYWDEMITEYIKVLATFFAPRARHSSLGLCRRLILGHRSRPMTNHLIERVELMLLLSRRVPFLPGRIILSYARRELERITKCPVRHVDWESLRADTVQLWHELYH